MEAPEREQLNRLRAYLKVAPTTYMERQNYFAKMHPLLEGFSAEVFREEVFDVVMQAFARFELDDFNCLAHPEWTRAFFEGQEVPQLMLVTSFSFNKAVSSSQALRLFAQGSWPRLRRLLFMGVSFDEASAAWFDGAQLQLPALRSFVLHMPGGEPLAFEALARWSALDSLEALSLTGLNGQLTLAVAQALAPRQWSLKHLHINDAAPYAEALDALLSSPCLSQLEHLNIGASLAHKDPRGDQIAASIARSPALVNLRFLELVGLGIGDSGCISLAQERAKTLAEAIELDAIKLLNLAHNDAIGAEGLASIASKFKALETLRLNECAINVDRIIPLTRAGALPALKVLELGSCSIYSDEKELWTDWNGSIVGEGPRRMTPNEIKQTYFNHRSGLQVR